MCESKAQSSVAPTQPGYDERSKYCDLLRERILAGRQSNYESMDKYILTLSSGALALSMSFVKDVVPLESALLFPALIASWAAFTAATLSIIISHVLSRFAHDRQILNLEKYRDGQDDALDGKFNPCRKWTEHCNEIAAACFMIGLLCTLAFVVINTSGGRSMNKGKNQHEEKAIVPPTVPRPAPVSPQPIQQKPEPPATPKK